MPPVPDLSSTWGALVVVGQEKEATSKALAALEIVAIQSSDQLAWAVGICQAAKARWNELENQRKAITKPLLDVKASIDAQFKSVQELLLASERVLKKAIADYNEHQEEARVTAMLAATSGGELAIPEPVDIKGLGIRQTWDFEVVDPDLVPRALCVPDEAKIKGAIPKSGEEPKSISGVRFFRKSLVTVRGPRNAKA